jgi:arylsulfatase A-like enzyme
MAQLLPPLSPRAIGCAVCLTLALFAPALRGDDAPAALAPRPNMIVILADDLGYGDLGCYGQRQIQTPHLDRLAAEGVRFTHGNARVPLRPEDVTVAEVLRTAGYRTAIIGKWGLGEPETTGLPRRQGFDSWFGFLNQNHAHNHYPDYLWENETRVSIVGNVVEKGVARERAHYAQDLFTERALAFLASAGEQPFFLYLAYTVPHANNEAGALGMEVPDASRYAGKPWPQPQKNHAAMIGRLDADVGRIVGRLRELGLDERTLIVFTSDNGPHQEGGADPKFFNSSGGLRGIKRDLYEGGIRVPLLARWPRAIAPGRTSDYACANWDFLPTLAELAGAQPPDNLDGASLVPTLLGAEGAGREQPPHGDLYWEFHERGFQQAIRRGQWKGVRLAQGAALELYDLATDPGEERNIAAEQPKAAAELTAALDSARTPSEDWPAPTP